MKNFVLTGPPGVGKTTCVRRVAEIWSAAGGSVSGFYTEEVRDRGRRIGFDIVGFDGSRAALARQQQFALFASSARVGQYLVDVASIDEAAVRHLESAAVDVADKLPGQLMIIDEIGKMELFSERFRSACDSALAAARASASEKFSLICTVPNAWRHPIIDRLRGDSKHFELVLVKPDNREALPHWLARECGL